MLSKLVLYWPPLVVPDVYFLNYDQVYAPTLEPPRNVALYHATVLNTQYVDDGPKNYAVMFQQKANNISN